MEGLSLPHKLLDPMAKEEPSFGLCLKRNNPTGLI